MKSTIEIFEEDGSIFANIDGRVFTLAKDSDIDIKTEIAFDNIVDEITCDLDCFHERSNIDALISSEDRSDNEVKRGRR